MDMTCDKFDRQIGNYHSEPVEDAAKRNVKSFLDACHRGDLEVFQQAVQIVGLDQDGNRVLDVPQLSKAIQRGCDTAVIHKHADILNELFQHRGAKVTEYMFLCARGKLHVPTFEVLLRHGMDPNMTFGASETALLLSIHDEPLVRLLLSYGASAAIAPPYGSQYDMQTPWPKRPLDLAARSSIEVFDLLLAHGAKIDENLPLHGAVWGDTDDTGERIPMMQHILDLRVDINQLDEARSMRARGTALHYAVILKRSKTVEFLLQHGADARVESEWCLHTKHKSTALQLAEDSTPKIQILMRDCAQP